MTRILEQLPCTRKVFLPAFWDASTVLQLLFREPDVDQHSTAQLLRFCHKAIRSLEDLRNSLYLGLSVYKIGGAFLIAFSPHALVSFFWEIKFVSNLE